MDPLQEKRGLVNFRTFIVLGVALIFIFMIAYFFYGLQPNTANAAAVQFKIVKGEGFREIGARLSQLSLIKSLTVFKVYSFISGRVQKFQPGLYELSSSMTLPQIVSTLTSGGKNEATVTITEGTTLKDIDAMLASAGVIKAGALINFPIQTLVANHPYLTSVDSLEGFLFPDTYRFEFNSSSSVVVEKFLQNFEVKAWSYLQNDTDWYHALILASYLEREVPNFNDRQIVAGILLKRIKNGMPLQVDATISYAKCGGEFNNCPNLGVGANDLNINSPYNTYKNYGWTPTPIGNPGQDAIQAALTPKTSPYWYYLSASGTKAIIYAKTLREQNANRAKYL